MSYILGDYLNKYIERYAFNDLKSMENVQLPEGENDGYCGYPSLMTSLAAMEFLGSLLSHGKENLKYYWENYLVKVNPEKYGKNNLAKFFDSLVRDPLMHTFATAPGIGVGGSVSQSDHMTYSKNKHQLVVNQIQLAKDFEESYYKFFRPVLDVKTNHDKAQNKLDQVLNNTEKKVSHYFANLDDGENPQLSKYSGYTTYSGASGSPSIATSTVTTTSGTNEKIITLDPSVAKGLSGNIEGYKGVVSGDISEED